MNRKNLYSMTDSAIAEELGRRLEQIRLEANKPQKEIAYELGISEGTYRKAIMGKARFEVIIGIMRILEQLENLKNFLPDQPFSPIEMLKLQGKKRQRAASKKSGNTRTSKEDKVTHNIALEGDTKEEIMDYFVSSYGETILASPPPKGFSVILWLLNWKVLSIWLSRCSTTERNYRRYSVLIGGAIILRTIHSYRVEEKK